MKNLRLAARGAGAALWLLVACHQPRAIPVEPVGDGRLPAPVSVPSATDDAAGVTGKVYRFAFIPKCLDDPVYAYAKTGAERQAAQYGDVKILWEAPASLDAQRQKDILDRAIAEGVDGIAIACIDSGLLTPSIDRAAAVGIPVVTFDSDAPDSKRAAFYGIDDFAAGVQIGEEVVKLLGPAGGEVAALTTGGADNLLKRVEGFKSAIRNHPVRLVEAFDVQDDAATAGKVVLAANRTYPNLRAWVSVGGWPLFNNDIINSMDPAKAYWIIFDPVPESWDLIKSGKIQLAVGQKFFGWGSASTRLLYEIAAHQKYPAAAFVNSGVDMVSRDNIDGYITKWKQMGSGQAVE